MNQNIEQKRKKSFAHTLFIWDCKVSYLTNRQEQDPKFWVCGPGVSLCGTDKVFAQGMCLGLYLLRVS